MPATCPLLELGLEHLLPDEHARFKIWGVPSQNSYLIIIFTRRVNSELSFRVAVIPKIDHYTEVGWFMIVLLCVCPVRQFKLRYNTMQRLFKLFRSVAL